MRTPESDDSGSDGAEALETAARGKRHLADVLWACALVLECEAAEFELQAAVKAGDTDEIGRARARVDERKTAAANAMTAIAERITPLSETFSNSGQWVGEIEKAKKFLEDPVRAVTAGIPPLPFVEEAQEWSDGEFLDDPPLRLDDFLGGE